MRGKSAIVVILDRLGSAYLGPYGNTWIDTPALNSLAGRSRLWESAISDTPSLTGVYGAYWQGRPAYCPQPAPPDAAQRPDSPPTGRLPVSGPSLPALLSAAGVPATLLTDSPNIAAISAPAAFGRRIELPSPRPEQPAETIEQTACGQLIAAAVQWLSETSSPSLLWLHAQAMEHLWDAPRRLRAQFTEEGDPAPFDGVDPPDFVLSANVDPDRLLAFTHAYAGHVVAIDVCLGALQRVLDESTHGDQTLLIVTSPRGFPLGEHGCVGRCGDDLFAEVLQVPLLVRMPGDEHAGERLGRLAQPVDLYATLLDFFSLKLPASCFGWGQSLLLPASPDSDRQCDFACSVHDQRWSLRTPIWFFRQAAQNQLYAKPDDRWEVNEVADRCGDVASTLDGALAEIREATEAGDPGQLPSLPPELVDELPGE